MRHGLATPVILVLGISLAAGCQRYDSLHEAVEARDESAVAEFLKHGADPNARNEYGDTPLHVAAMRDDAGALTRLLIEKGAEVDAQNTQGWTPLHRALFPEVAQLLIAHGADVNARDKNGSTPLHIAVGSEHGRVREENVLVTGPGSARIKQRIAATYAARRRALVETLISKGADLTAKDTVGRTPLHLAARAGFLEDVKTLVAHGADLYAKDDYGDTPFDSARITNRGKDVAEFLRSRMGPQAVQQDERPKQTEHVSVEELAKRLTTSRNATERRDAADALGAYALEKGGADVKAALPALIEALRDVDAGVRREVAFTLTRIGPEAASAVPALTRALEKDENPRVRADAAMALGEIGPDAKDAVPELIRATKSEFLGLRKTAVDALGQIGPFAKAAAPALISAMQDDSAYVRRRAAQALGRIGAQGEGVASALTRGLEDKDKRVRVWSASALQRVQPASGKGLNALVRFLGDDDREVRYDAVRAIGEAGPAAKDAAPALIKAFKTIGQEGRMDFLAEALGKMGPAGIDTLIAALREGDAEIRSRAAWALGWIGPNAKAALPALVKAAKDADPTVRILAEDALRRIRQEGNARDADP